MAEQFIECRVVTLGQVPYAEAWALQEKLVAQRSADESPDTLLLLEHPHTYTMGSSAHEENLIFTAEQRAELGIELHYVNRGGDVTYHGPGQLVGYPIFKLPAGGDGLHADVIAYVRQIEQALIMALSTYQISAHPYAGYTGVWLDYHGQPAKIAAIGVKVNTRRVTMHGFAINVNTDLSYFKGIIPCGIEDKPVTSMAQVLDRPVDLKEVSARVAESFGKVFARAMHSSVIA
jgi:lipoyl(octanoyl) transferase